MNIYFLSNNRFKIEEVVSILNSDKITIYPVSQKINEIQSSDMVEIVKDKALKAFQQVGHPILVEQTGLLIKDFGNLPGGLTQIFWDSLMAERFSAIFSKIGSSEAVAKTVLGYCDGKHILTFDGVIEGHIICPPRGDKSFQWDCVFEPKGYDKTFAELSKRKNEISMRRIALNKLKKYLENI